MQYRSYALGEQPKWISDYISSLDFDREICPYVKDVLTVHIRELARAGYVKRPEELIKALEEFDCTELKGIYEDVHEAIEYYLINKVEEAKWINLGKSRNDQVATAIRLRTREELLDVLDAVYSLLSALYTKAKLYGDVPFPTFTHLQPAQPGNLGLYLLSFAEEVVDSITTLFSALEVTDKCPLGAAASAGSTVDLSRERRCEELCFGDMALDALYATTSRTFAISSISSLLILSLPLQRLAEDMFVFSTPSLGLVVVPDDHAGTSSIMPHKRNPATLEVARAELSKLAAQLISAYVLLKGLPSGYTLDLQQLTPLLWESFRTFRKACLVLADFIEKLEVNEDKINEIMKLPLQAADVAEYLSVRKGIPFREAYAAVARAVKEKGYDMRSIAEAVLGEEAEEALKEPISRRKAPGAPGNLSPVFDKVSRKMEEILKVLERRYEYWECPRT